MAEPKSTSAASWGWLADGLGGLGLASVVLLGVSRLVPLLSSVLASVVELAARAAPSHGPGL